MKKEKNPLYHFLKPICVGLLHLLYHPKITGKENVPSDGALIFAGNHKHAVDPIMVIASTKRVVHFMAKEFLFRGLHGWVFKKIGLIEIYKNRSNQLAVIEAEKMLKDGGTVGIFPEGTRNRTENLLLKFRHGTVAIAKNTNTMIVPFAIKGKYKLFRKGVSITFGKPIDVSNMEIEEANDYLKEQVRMLLEG